MDQRNNTFDLIRGVAIIYVLLAHFFTRTFPCASIGVSIFFALSGYLIAKILMKNPMNLKQFYIHRFFRVYPPLLIAVVAILLVKYFLGYADFGQFAQELPRVLLFYHSLNWFGFGSGVWWTLYMEFFFYITLPIIFLIFPNNRDRMVCIITLSIISFILLFYSSSHTDFIPFWLNIIPLMQFCWWGMLGLGSITALIHIPQKLVFFMEVNRRSVIWSCAIGIFFIAVTFDVSERTFLWPFGALLSSAISCVWILTTKFDGDIKRNPITFMGLISYSLYLSHGIFRDLMERHGIFPARLSYCEPWLFIFVSILLSTITYKFIEVPSMALGRYLGQSHKKQELVKGMSKLSV